jgi:hypothetical protein
MRSLLLACALSLASASCADDFSVNVRYASGYHPTRAAVSVLGVFRNGRMSTESWGPLSGPLSAALGGSEACEPVFGERLQRENEELYQSIDGEVRDAGITEELLGRLGPRAKGDLILTISVHGGIADSTTEHRTSATQVPNMPSPMRSAGARGARGARGGQNREVPPRGPYSRGLELIASLYSVREHTPVARLQVTYGGTSTEEALRRFTAEIGAMAPGSTCRGWTVAAPPPDSATPLLQGP